jgi:hypothetical protein
MDVKRDWLIHTGLYNRANNLFTSHSQQARSGKTASIVL